IDQAPRQTSEEVRMAAVLLRQALLAKATELARAGRYAEAERLLSEAPDDGARAPATLDLLARIHAQQGNLREAEACWGEAARLAPEHNAYRAGLARIARLQSRSVRRSRILPGLIGLVMVAVGIVLFSLIVKRESHEPGAETAIPTPKPETTSARAGPPNVQMDVRIAIPGVTLKPEGSALVVIFDEGLFTNGSVLKPEARILLASLGRQLAPHAGRITVTVIGHTDHWPMPAGRRYRDNAALGLARAVAVVERLRATAHLPGGAFSAVGAGEATPPYPNDAHSHARNRTVTLRIASLGR
ncbi:MAG: OmpA family protein, partial [Blastocatellia bacterium]